MSENVNLPVTAPDLSIFYLLHGKQYLLIQQSHKEKVANLADNRTRYFHIHTDTMTFVFDSTINQISIKIPPR